MRFEPEANKRVLILMNPAARNGRSIVATALEIAKHTSTRLDLIIPNASSRAEQVEMAREALRQGVDAVLVAGGDGALNGAINLIAPYDVPLGLIPTGSGNDFARALGIRRKHPKHVVKVLLDAIEQSRPTLRVDAISVTLTHDRGETRNLLVANSINIGFDAAVNRRANALRLVPASLRYLLALLQEVRRFLPFNFTVSEGDEQPSEQDLALVCIQNGPFIGGGIPLAPAAQISNGLIEVSSVRAVARPLLFLLFPLLFMRRHAWLTPLTTRRTDRVSVTVPQGVSVFADGEEVLASTRSEVQVDVVALPGVFRIIQGH